MKVSTQNLLEWPLGRLCLLLAPPAVGATLLHGLNAVLDMAWAGHLLGADAVAALAVIHSLNHLVFSLESLVAVGSAALLSRRMGAGLAVSSLYRATLLLCLLLGGVALLLGYVLAPSVLAQMGLSGNSLALGWEYYRWYLPGIPVVMYAFTTGSLLQAQGLLGRMTRIVVVGVVLNAVLTPGLIMAGFGLGGAALATVLAQWVVCVSNIRILRHSAGFSLSFWNVDWGSVRQLLVIGQSGALVHLIYLAQGLLVFSVIAEFGNTNDTAFMGACYRLVLLGVYISTGFSRALQPVIGINMGANQPQRAWQAFIVFNLVGLGVMLLYWLPLMSLPESVFGLLLPDIPFTGVQIQSFRTYGMILLLTPFLLMGITLYQGCGRATLVTSLGLFRLLVLFVPAIYWLPKWLGLIGVYWALAAVDISLFGVMFAVTFAAVRPQLAMRGRVYA